MTVYRQDNRLVIDVLNNGQRLTVDQLSHLKALTGETQPAEGHVGVRNISQRLRLIYGDKASLTFQVDAHSNTIATIRMPLHTVAQA